MELRKLIARDTAAVKRLHAAMGLDYELPLADHGGDLRKTVFVRTGIFDDGRLVTAVLGRLTSEAYLLLDRTWSTPAERWEAAGRAMVCAAQQAVTDGIEDVHVWLPPAIEKRFGKRLAEFAFVKAPWNCYTAKL
jgi:hypothetical protein